MEGGKQIENHECLEKNQDKTEKDALLEKSESVDLCSCVRSFLHPFCNFGRPSGRDLTRIEAAVILLSFSYGTAVIVLPNTVVRLGPVLWIHFITAVVATTAYCAYLNNQSTQSFLETQTTSEDVRDVYFAVAELAAGQIFRKFVAVCSYVAMLTSSVGFVLLGSSLLSDAFPIDNYSYYNSIRIWVLVASVVLAPFMYPDNFKDLIVTANFAVIASVIASIAVFTNCMVYRFFETNNSTDKRIDLHKSIDANDIFISFGLITFAVAGPSFELPNILIHVKEPKKFAPTVIYVFVLIYVIYIFTSTIPYIVFGDQISNIVTQAFRSLRGEKQRIAIINIMTIICDVSMSLHLIMESVLVINPLYQHIEDMWIVPRGGFHWKRVVIRTCGILFILACCLVFPRFQSVLSIVGGVPLTFVGIICPIYIYERLFDVGLWRHVLHICIMVVFSGFMIGNFGISFAGLIS